MYVSKLYSYKLVGVEFRVEINIIYESEIIAHRWTLLKMKKIHMHLYFKAEQYVWNNAFVDQEYNYIDNWTGSFSLVIIYRNRQK